jgi:hypothetical protein
VLALGTGDVTPHRRTFIRVTELCYIRRKPLRTCANAFTTLLWVQQPGVWRRCGYRTTDTGSNGAACIQSAIMIEITQSQYVQSVRSGAKGKVGVHQPILEGDTENSSSQFSFTTTQCKRASKTMYSPWVAFCAGPLFPPGGWRPPPLLHGEAHP